MNIAHAITKLHPGASSLHDFSVRDDNDGRGPYIDHWNLPAPLPTQAELEAAYAKYQAEREATEYQRLRKAAYDAEMPLGDQLDAILKGGDALAAMQAKHAEIKTRYPEPEAADAS